jgi:hypothetical protein
MPCSECQRLYQVFFSLRMALWNLEAHKGTDPEYLAESEGRLQCAQQALIEHQTGHMVDYLATQD